MSLEPNKQYYNSSVGFPGPYTPNDLLTHSKLGGRIEILYRDADGMTNGESSVRIIWIDETAMFLERGAENDFMVPWGDVFYILLEKL